MQSGISKLCVCTINSSDLGKQAGTEAVMNINDKHLFPCITVGPASVHINRGSWRRNAISYHDYSSHSLPLLSPGNHGCERKERESGCTQTQDPNEHTYCTSPAVRPRTRRPIATMPDFTDALKPAQDGTAILTAERSGSDVPIEALSNHLFSSAYLERQSRVLKILETDPLFQKQKQYNLSRPERYQLGLARAKKLKRYAEEYGWSIEDHEMGQYLCDDVSPYMVHFAMFATTVREQGSEEQKAKWMGRIEGMEVVGCYAQYVFSPRRPNRKAAWSEVL